jgi:hypothetical protein
LSTFIFSTLITFNFTTGGSRCPCPFPFAIQEQLDNTIRQLRQVHQYLDLFTAAYPAIEVAKETRPPPKTNAPAPPPPPPLTVLEQIGDWFSRNWIIVAAVALLGLWGVTRFFTRS